jgi:hypothetical protein
MANDKTEKPRVMQDQQAVLNQRYDLSNNPIPGMMMSGGRKPVQGGVRVKLPPGITWDTLNSMSPDEIRQRGLLPPGFMPSAGTLRWNSGRSLNRRALTGG